MAERRGALPAATGAGDPASVGAQGSDEPPEVIHRFRRGWFFWTYTGADGLPARALAEALGPELLGLWRWDATTQRWASYRPGAPPGADTLGTIDRLDVLAVQFGRLVELDYTVPDLPAPAALRRAYVLQPGWNVLPYLGPYGPTVDTVLDADPRVTKAFVYRNDGQMWTGVSAGGPRPDADLTLARLDPVWVFVAGAAPVSIALPEVAPRATLDRPFVSRVLTTRAGVVLIDPIAEAVAALSDPRFGAQRLRALAERYELSMDEQGVWTACVSVAPDHLQDELVALGFRPFRDGVGFIAVRQVADIAHVPGLVGLRLCTPFIAAEDESTPST